MAAGLVKLVEAVGVAQGLRLLDRMDQQGPILVAEPGLLRIAHHRRGQRLVAKVGLVWVLAEQA